LNIIKMKSFPISRTRLMEELHTDCEGGSTPRCNKSPEGCDTQSKGCERHELKA
jgi:hypothetical protein